MMMLMVIGFASKEARYYKMKGRHRGDYFEVYWNKIADGRSREERENDGKKEKERVKEGKIRRNQKRNKEKRREWDSPLNARIMRTAPVIRSC